MIDIENLSSFSIDEKDVKNYVGQMLSHLSVNKKSYVSILFVEENEMARQHLKWMKEPGPTDVMSFPMDDVLLSNKKSLNKQSMLGDIIICPAIAYKDAIKQSIPPAKHLVFLLAHAILHLLGQDHQVPSQRGIMQKKEQGIMDSLRIVKKR